MKKSQKMVSLKYRKKSKSFLHEIRVRGRKSNISRIKGQPIIIFLELFLYF